MARGRGVRVEVRGDFGEARFTRQLGEAQKVLDIQVLKDTTPYVPRDTGNLKDTAIRSQVAGSGIIAWDGPYAAAQYYGLPNKAKDRHPLASMRWFDVAKAVCRSKWLEVAKRTGGGGN